MNVAAKSDPGPKLFRASAARNSGPVECLGTTFESDEARRKYFLERLKEKLPELRRRPDFPVGEDEDILRLSDPPYYTACPNPFVNAGAGAVLAFFAMPAPHHRVRPEGSLELA